MPADFELLHSEYSDCAPPDDDYPELAEYEAMMQANYQESEWDA